MKITKVDVFEVHTRRPAWRPVLCRIYTDEGIYGDGEAALAYGTAAPAAAGMIRDLATLIIGMDPLDNEVIWDKLYKSTFWGQNGGPVVFLRHFRTGHRPLGYQGQILPRTHLQAAGRQAPGQSAYLCQPAPVRMGRCLS